MQPEPCPEPVVNKGRARLRRTSRLVLVLLATAWCIGQVFRDAAWVTALCFYVPSPFLAALLLIHALLSRQRQREAIAAALLAFPPLWMTVAVENRWRSEAPESSAMAPLHLLHWNVLYGHLGMHHVEEEILRWSPDLLVLSETPRNFAVDRLAARLGDGFAAIRYRSLAIIARGGLEKNRSLLNTPYAKGYSLTWRGPAGALQVVVVNLASYLWFHRDPSLQKLVREMARRQPDIVVGDFNAPRRSRALSSLPEGFRHAYDAAGSGWSYSWPVPCPLYAIDQCILGPRIRPIRYGLHATRFSDHRLQVLQFEVEATGGRTVR